MEEILNSKRFIEYDQALDGKIDKDRLVYLDALYSVEDIFDTSFYGKHSFTPGSYDANIMDRVERVLLALMNLVVGNSTPSYECTIKLREQLAETQLGDKIFQMCEYLLPLPRSNWGDLSTNPDTASGLFDVKYDIQRVADFYKKMVEQDFLLIKDEFNVDPEEEVRILRNYLIKKLKDAQAEATICLTQVEAKNLADENYVKLVNSGSPLEIVYEDLLHVLKVITEYIEA